jgi:hypothetical protein
MYFGNSAGVLEFDGEFWRLIDLPQGSGAYALAADTAGRVYVGGQGKLGYLAPDSTGTMRYFSLRKTLPAAYQDFDDRVIQIVPTSKGMVFLADRLVLSYQDGTMQVAASEDHLFSAIYIDETLYVVDGAQGLARLEAGRLHGIAGGELLRAQVVLPFLEDQLLLMSAQKGRMLYRLPGQTEGAAFSEWVRPDTVFSRIQVASGVALQQGGFALGTYGMA